MRSKYIMFVVIILYMGERVLVYSLLIDVIINFMFYSDGFYIVLVFVSYECFIYFSIIILDIFFLYVDFIFFYL